MFSSLIGRSPMIGRAPSSRLTYAVLLRPFGATAPVSQRPDHPLYPLVDWALIKAGNRAIIDPFDPSAILYVTSKEYQRLVLVAISNETDIVVLATPSDKPTASDTSAFSSKTNSPQRKKLTDKERTARVAALLQDHLIPDDLQHTNFLHWGRRGISWKSWFGRYTTPVQSGSVRKLLLPDERNLIVILRRWGYTLSVMTGVTFGIGLRADLLAFTVHCHKVLASRGLMELTLRLRTYLFCVNQFLAGNPMKSTSTLGIRVRLSHGLPAALPQRVRHAIRMREPTAIRIWSSMLNAYRAFAVDPKVLTMGRIESPPHIFEEGSLVQFSNFLHSFWAGWSADNPKLAKPDLTIKKFPFLSTAGPNGSPSIVHSSKDAYAWFSSGLLPNLFRAWKTFGVTEEVSETFFASLARSDAVYLGPPGPGLPYVLQRLFTTSDIADPTKQWATFNPDTATRTEKLMNASKFFSSVKGAVRNFLENQYCDGPYPQGKYLTSKGSWVLASSKPKDRAWLARFLYQNMTPEGNINPEVRDHILRVLSAATNASNVPSTTLEGRDPVPSKVYLGRLSFKFGEPAGKTRWFAIVDYFTQQALLPIHDFLFDCLRTLVSDATFNQEAAVHRLATLGPKFWCYDLTAATDVIPLPLYKAVLAVFTDSKIAEAWATLLSDRKFVLKAGSVPKALWPKETSGPSQIIWEGRYTRGQPMGALSSWGALALTHHLIVQYAAFRCGETKKGKIFTTYAVLGDDIVIANESVASEYVKVCAELGVELNFLKSFVSENGFFQFAQRNWLGKTELSPLSLREETNVLTVQDRAAMVRRAIDRGYFSLDGTKNLIREIVKRFVTPNQAAFLSTRFWADRAGLGVDIASKIVAPLLLQPRGPLSGILKPTEGMVWEWLQSLTRAFADGNSLFHRGALIPDSQARWTHQDLVALYSCIVLPLQKELSNRVDTVRKNYLQMEKKLFGLRHECPLLPVAWITRIWDDFVPVYQKGEIFLKYIGILTFPGSPESGLPVPDNRKPLPPQGVAVALSSLHKILTYMRQFNPPFDLSEAKDPLKAQRSIDRHTARVRRFWVSATGSSLFHNRSPPYRDQPRKRKK